MAHPFLEPREQPLSRPVYLDYHAATPCDPRVVEAMLPCFLEHFANPSSTVHELGRKAESAAEDARKQVADLIRSSPGEIVFTSGATESNNLAILGGAAAAPVSRRRVLASAIEHKSVLEPCRRLERDGWQFHLIPVHRDGTVDLGALVDLADEQTALVSVQAANNEIGTIQPIGEIAQIAHRVGAVVHCDGAQAAARLPIDVVEWGVDLLSLSAHKCYGPKGTGALYMRGGPSSAPVEPLVVGGGHERGMRAGTLNVPGIVGFGVAADIARSTLTEESIRTKALRDWFEQAIGGAFPEVRRNGCLSHRLAGNASITFPEMDAEAVLANLPDIALSTGSACTSGALEPSYVLTAIGLTRSEAYGTIRVGMGRFTMEQELRDAASRLLYAIRRVKELAMPVAS